RVQFASPPGRTITRHPWLAVALAEAAAFQPNRFKAKLAQRRCLPRQSNFGGWSILYSSDFSIALVLRLSVRRHSTEPAPPIPGDHSSLEPEVKHVLCI